ncbi:MAG TPA: hypothetical protein VFR02_07015 [bacterium]|nr:hypothetical protein [bacterium]
MPTQDPEGPPVGPARDGEVPFGAFRSALSDYADLACEPIGAPVEGPAVMSLERSIRLSGPIRGLIVVRAHRRLGGLLLERAAGGNGHSDSREAAFDYLVRLFAEKWVRSRWALGDFDPLTTDISSPQVWPLGPPRDSAALLVEHCPVEIRIWWETKEARP